MNSYAPGDEPVPTRLDRGKWESRRNEETGISDGNAESRSDVSPGTSGDDSGEVRVQTTRIQVLLGLWSGLQIASILWRNLTVPTGDGFTRGMNRLSGILGFQGVAAILALSLFVLARRSGLAQTWRIIATVPFALTTLSILGLVGVILWTLLGN